MNGTFQTDSTKTTSYKVVLPFYVYAAISFLIACLLLFLESDSFHGHYFHPQLLTITHTMALGWGTMIILGASHQLVPVLIESRLFSDKLAMLSFYLAAIGIPLLLYGFYTFNMGTPAKWGGILVILAILTYLINLLMSMLKSSRENIHATFVFTATVWLMFTAIFGLALIYNFSDLILRRDSLHYLPLHAHLGIVGWFLLLVIGVGSRLIPMFLISKYNQPSLLKVIYTLINLALLLYIVLFYIPNSNPLLRLIPTCLIAASITLFIYYCYQAYKQRLRKSVDEPIKISLLSIAMMLLPFVLLTFILGLLQFTASHQYSATITYGFVIFFGWLTAIILGMTFKTLPFIVWNKVYRNRSANNKPPSPKELFNLNIFKAMAVAYLLGFVSFALGVFFSLEIVLKLGSLLLILTAILYNWNVIKAVSHKAIQS